MTTDILIIAAFIMVFGGLKLMHDRKPAGPQGPKSTMVMSVDDTSNPLSVSGRAARLPERSADAINGVIARSKGAIQFCCKKELLKQPGLSGTVTVTFTIEHTGRVSRATVVSSSINSSSMKACLAKTLERLRFPAIDAADGSIAVTFPFVYKNGKFHVDSRERTPIGGIGTTAP